MKSRPIRRSAIALSLTCAASGIADALITPIFTPSAVTWTNVADTLAIAKSSWQTGSTPISPFFGFDPPVVPQYDPNCAFKAKLSALGTGPTDQGVWSTGPTWKASSGVLQPTAILREGDTTPSSLNTFGSAGALTISNLQIGTAGMTACMANTNIPLGKMAVLDNGCLQSLGESPFATWKDLRPPVLSSFNNTGVIGIWKRDLVGVFPSGVDRIGVALPTPAGLCPTLTNSWGSGFGALLTTWAPDQIPRTASPSISASGRIALYGRDTFLPPNTARHIRVASLPPGPVSAMVVRERTPCPAVPSFVAAGDFFGTIHDRLMANADQGTAAGGMVAWQMQNMRDSASLVINRTSLWCKLLPAGSFNCIAFQGQPAPDLPATNTIQSFYALHVAADSSSSNNYWVFWGALLNTTGKKAIYRTYVAGGVAALPDLIATDLPRFTPVTPFVGGTSINLTNLAPYFSVNIDGYVLFKATCAVLPPQQHILVTASPVNNHARQVRAQSGIAGTILDSTGASHAASNFFLATPDQGVFSRGQAIGTGGMAAKITFPGNQGIFFGL